MVRPTPWPTKKPRFEELLERIERLERVIAEKDRRIAELERLLEQSRRGGPSRRRYAFRWGTSQKLSRHTTNDSTLRAHRSPDGWRCSSRRGHLERTD